MMIEIKQTETYRKWEHKLKDRKARAIIAARVFRLANGMFGDVTSVGLGISELRIHYGPGYRIYFKQNGNEIIISLYYYVAEIKALKNEILNPRKNL